MPVDLSSNPSYFSQNVETRSKEQLPNFVSPVPKTVFFTMDEVAKHNTKNDAWCVIEGKVYNITNFLQHHPGFDLAGQVSTVLAILRNIGQDCTEEFLSIHSRKAYAQLQDYYIGDLKL